MAEYVNNVRVYMYAYVRNESKGVVINCTLLLQYQCKYRKMSTALLEDFSDDRYSSFCLLVCELIILVIKLLSVSVYEEMHY